MGLCEGFIGISDFNVFSAILCWDIRHFPYGHSGGRAHFQTDISPVLVLHPIYITTIFIVLGYDISMIYTL